MIIKSGTPIGMGPQADETLKLARDELLGFLSRSPGAVESDQARLRIEFATGSGRGYTVRNDAGRLLFSGPTPVDVLHAVYTFAEEWLGFCFYEPGHDRVRTQSRVELPPGEVVGERVPLMKIRGLIQEYPPDEGNYRLADWMAKNRLNFLYTWMKHYERFPQAMRDYYRIRGIRISSGHHNFDYYIPMERYAESHPEFFAEIGGERIKPEAGDDALLLSKQLCVSHPSLRDELARRMLEYAAAHPELDSVNLAPNDGFGWCECARCRPFQESAEPGELFCVSEHVRKGHALYQDLITDMAARIHRERPDLTVGMSAYINYVEPGEGFRLGRGMEAHVALYWRCINHALDDPTCPINRRYLRVLEQWSAAKDGGTVWAYEYYMGVNFYVSLPMVHHRVIFRELRAMAAAGVDGVATQYHLPHWTAYGMNYWMMAKAAYGDDEAAVDRGMRGLFGDAAAEADAFYAQLRAVQLSAGRCLLPVPRSLLNRTAAKDYRDLLERAHALQSAYPDEPLFERIAVWMDYLQRWKTLFDRYHDGGISRADLEDFMAWADSIRPYKVVVAARLKRYLAAWLECLDTGRPWVHFNIDWEDPYVLRYDELLNRDW